jgi:hypothetical protein
MLSSAPSKWRNDNVAAVPCCRKEASFRRAKLIVETAVGQGNPNPCAMPISHSRRTLTLGQPLATFQGLQGDGKRKVSKLTVIREERGDHRL